jgi:K+-sensing histidine kinase KdpD
MRGALRDITEQKQAEEQLERLRSEFYGVISHELKTPLTVIKGSAAMGLSSRRTSTNPDEVRELLQVINAQSDRLAELVNNLLDMTRIEAGTFSVETGEADLGEDRHRRCTVIQHAGYAHRIEVNRPAASSIEPMGGVSLQVLTNLEQRRQVRPLLNHHDPR